MYDWFALLCEKVKNGKKHVLFGLLFISNLTSYYGFILVGIQIVAT